MSAKGIFEAKGKALLNAALGDLIVPNKSASVDASTDWTELEKEHPWLTSTVCIFGIYLTLHQCVLSRNTYYVYAIFVYCV